MYETMYCVYFISCIRLYIFETIYFIVKIFETTYFIVKIFETILFHVLDYILFLLCLLYSMYQTIYYLCVQKQYNAPKSRRT
jgi:hypothetical protein